MPEIHSNLIMLQELELLPVHSLLVQISAVMVHSDQIEQTVMEP